MNKAPEKIAIVGTGLIGSSWAAFYAAHGFMVALYDAHPDAAERGRQKAECSLGTLHQHELLTDKQYDDARERLEIASDLAAAVAGARLVQESVAEDYAVKADVIQKVDRHSDPSTIVASSTSGLLISQLQSEMEHPERSLIAHPFNPPHLIPLVELVPGPQTGARTLQEALALFESLGKVPVVLRKEVPGHIANRLQAAVWREAIQLVLDGVASVGDVDRALAAGPGIRWALLGSHTIFHLGGGAGGIRHFTEHIGRGWGALWQDMAHWTSLPEETPQVLSAGLEDELAGRSLEELALWRDERLVQLVKLIYASPADTSQ